MLSLICRSLFLTSLLMYTNIALDSNPSYPAVWVAYPKTPDTIDTDVFPTMPVTLSWNEKEAVDWPMETTGVGDGNDNNEDDTMQETHNKAPL